MKLLFIFLQPDPSRWGDPDELPINQHVGLLFIAALILGKTHKEALLWGPINAGSVVQQVGPQAGLLVRHELEADLKKLKSYKTISITDAKIKKHVLEMVEKKKD